MFRPFVLIAIAVALLSPQQRQWPPSVAGAPRFESVEGRFSIALPERTGFGALTIPTPFGAAKGDLYQWQTKEGTFGVGFAEARQPLNDPEIAKQVFNKTIEAFKKLGSSNNANLAEVKQITLDKYPGIEQRADLFTGSIIQRTYIVSQRIYETVAVLTNNQKSYESVALGVLDSFRLLTDVEVNAKIAEETAKAEPSPLPQTPVAPRAGSDASDDGLRGRVKSVLTENQDLSGTRSAQTRMRTAFETYNEQGNLLRRESYDYKGNLSDINVFGYIDGSRVSAFETIQHAYDPPDVIGPPGTPAKKWDPRYQYRFAFKYDDKKRLTELTYFHNNGDIWLRYVYKYKGNQKEELVYSANGSVNRRYVATLDDKGNEVEETTFDQNGSVSSKEAYAYEFDSQGNWTKRTTSEVVTKDGRTQLEPQSVEYRTITYYQ